MHALHRLRGDFTASARAEKVRLLKQLSRTRESRVVALLRLHDELLFLASFPDNPTIATLAERALRRFWQRIQRLTRPSRARLSDSGIAGSESAHTFMYGVVRWLVRHGERVTPSWKDNHDAERLEPLLRQTMLPVEGDAFDSGAFTTRGWIEHASARVKGGPLYWLVGPREGPPGSRELYDHAEVPVTWSIGDSPRSVTRNRAPVAETTYRSSFRRPPQDPIAWIARPLAGVRRVTGDEAIRWIDASIAALVARCREVVPTIYANTEEVYVAELGEGAQLCVIGAQLEDRLALEANYGYVIFSNGVPIGYGGVTPLADQANTGTNLFEAFRGSEAAYLFGQSLRAFRALFGVSRFVVNRFQFGADNDEALQSGAFWFYDRLGFRSVDATARALASRERTRLTRRHGSRSSVAILRRLASSDVVLELNPLSTVPRFDEHNLAKIGRLIAADLADIPSSERDTHLHKLALTHAELLGGVHRSLTGAELRGARLLGPVISLIERTIAAWSPEHRGALWELVRAKGAKQERRFAHLSSQHAPFWRAVTDRCAGSARGAGDAP
jgi:hypothetical protein